MNCRPDPSWCKLPERRRLQGGDAGSLTPAEDLQLSMTREAVLLRHSQIRKDAAGPPKAACWLAAFGPPSKWGGPLGEAMGVQGKPRPAGQINQWAMTQGCH